MLSVSGLCYHHQRVAGNVVNVQMLRRGSWPKPAQHFPQIEHKIELLKNKIFILFFQQMVSKSCTYQPNEVKLNIIRVGLFYIDFI